MAYRLFPNRTFFGTKLFRRSFEKKQFGSEKVDAPTVLTLGLVGCQKINLKTVWDWLSS